MVVLLNVQYSMSNRQVEEEERIKSRVFLTRLLVEEKGKTKVKYKYALFYYHIWLSNEQERQ